MSINDMEEGMEKGALDKKEKEVGVDDEAKSKENEGKEDQDVVFVQDIGFTVKIVAPNLEPFDIQVTLNSWMMSGSLRKS
jgi:protein TIF31